MKNHPATFADYKDPPVCEVVLSIQYERITKLRTPHLGFLWGKYKETRGLVKVQEHHPLPQAYELFGLERPAPRIRLSTIPEVPRCWFLSEDETELVQVQQDRFAHNWRRKQLGTRYPKYRTIRKAFLEDLDIFEAFLRENSLGELTPNLCEITYVNPIPLEAKWNSFGKLHEVLTVVSPKFSDSFLPEPETVNIELSFVIPDVDGSPIGRLHVLAQPVPGDINNDAFHLRLTVQGIPAQHDREEIMRILDLGHEWIVKGFGSITTKSMHKLWGKKNGN